MTEPHDWAIETPIYKICRRCAQPDLVQVRQAPCRPLEPAQAEAEILRKLEWIKRLQTGVLGGRKPHSGRG